MKIFLLAVFCLILGYGVSLFVPAETIGLGDLKRQVEQFETPAAPKENTAPTTEPTLQTYTPHSFLVESDFLLTPGSSGPLAFRVGVAVSASAADSLIKSLKPTIATVKSRYLTANNRQAVVVIGGEFEDRSAAEKARRTLQPSIRNRLQIIALPPCVTENKPDDEGFVCGPPPPPPETNEATVAS